MRECDVIKAGSTWRIAVLPEEDRTTVTYNGQLVTFGHMVPEIGGRMHTDALVTVTSLLS